MSESHCMRFVTCASETRFCVSGGVCGLIVMAAWGCGAVMTSRCGEGLRLAPRGGGPPSAAILAAAKAMGQPASLHKPRGLPFVQPGSLGFHLTSCSDAAAPTGSLKAIL